MSEQKPPSARALRAARAIAAEVMQAKRALGPIDVGVKVEEVGIERWAMLIDAAMAEPAAPPGDGDAALLGLASIVKHLDQRVTTLEAQLEDATPPVADRLELVEAVELAEVELGRWGELFGTTDSEEARANMDQLRQALIKCDSYLSLLRHRQERQIEWGSPGIPRIDEVDRVIGAARQVTDATKPAEDAAPPQGD